MINAMEGEETDVGMNREYQRIETEKPISFTLQVEFTNKRCTRAKN